METSKYMKLNIMGESDDADITKVAENFSKIDEAAELWSNFGNTGTVLETESDFQIANEFPVPDDENAIFAITVKMPRAFAEGDTITVAGIAYNLYQGTDPALSDAWKAGEVVTINFDKTSRRCWASAGGGAPRPLPAQVSNMQASTPEGETPTIVFTWTNPVDENFAGMVLIVKEGSAPNSVTDGTQVYKGSGTAFTYTEGVQWEHTYFARGFAYNSQGKYQLDATGAIASATPSDVPNQVSDLVLTPNKSSATLTWTNPTQQSYSVTKVIQKIDSDPENPNDGTEVYSGTDTTVTVSNLQDSINYHFAVFAISKSGKYKPPVVKNYTPEIWPKYDYTGNATLIKDNAEQGWWRIKFLSSGVLTWLSEDSEVDVFLVGGGGTGGYVMGGGGGYTKTVKKITLNKNQRVQITIGAGGASYLGDGGTTTFDSYSVSGGEHGGTNRSTKHGNGGSGGGGSTLDRSITAGSGGTDGASGGGGNDNGTTFSGGLGQGSTTREFGDSGADLYSGGGGGMNMFPDRGDYSPVGGSGGGGSPVLATNGKKNLSSSSSVRVSVGKAGGGYGGGGGAGTDSASGNLDGGVGAQGIAIIRNARE